LTLAVESAAPLHGFARTCYDHLAGQLGVAIADALVAKGHIVLAEDGGEVTDSGEHFLSVFGADLTSKSRSRRIFCRPCLDWSERRYHVAGLVGVEVCRRCLELGWLKRDRDTRAMRVTPAGQIGLRDTFGISLNDSSRAPAPPLVACRWLIPDNHLPAR